MPVFQYPVFPVEDPVFSGIIQSKEEKLELATPVEQVQKRFDKAKAPRRFLVLFLRVLVSLWQAEKGLNAHSEEKSHVSAHGKEWSCYDGYHQSP